MLSGDDGTGMGIEAETTYCIGRKLARAAMEKVRKLAEQCDGPITFLHFAALGSSMGKICLSELT